MKEYIDHDTIKNLMKKRGYLKEKKRDTRIATAFECPRPLSQKFNNRDCIDITSAEPAISGLAWTNLSKAPTAALNHSAR